MFDVCIRSLMRAIWKPDPSRPYCVVISSHNEYVDCSAVGYSIGLCNRVRVNKVVHSNMHSFLSLWCGSFSV